MQRLFLTIDDDDGLLTKFLLNSLTLRLIRKLRIKQPNCRPKRRKLVLIIFQTKVVGLLMKLNTTTAQVSIYNSIWQQLGAGCRLGSLMEGVGTDLIELANMEHGKTKPLEKA
jgi:hypothetical protein